MFVNEIDKVLRDEVGSSWGVSNVEEHVTCASLRLEDEAVDIHDSAVMKSGNLRLVLVQRIDGVRHVKEPIGRLVAFKPQPLAQAVYVRPQYSLSSCTKTWL